MKSMMEHIWVINKFPGRKETLSSCVTDYRYFMNMLVIKYIKELKISRCVGFRMSCVRKGRRSYCKIVKTFEWV